MLSTSRVAWIAAVILAAFGAITTLSSGPKPKAATTFEGSVSREGVSAHSFTVQREGAIEVTLTNLRPAATTKVGLGVGTQLLLDGDTIAPRIWRTASICSSRPCM